MKRWNLFVGLMSEVFRTDGFYVSLTLKVKTEDLMKIEV